MLRGTVITIWLLVFALLHTPALTSVIHAEERQHASGAEDGEDSTDQEGNEEDKKEGDENGDGEVSEEEKRKQDIKDILDQLDKDREAGKQEKLSEEERKNLETALDALMKGGALDGLDEKALAQATQILAEKAAQEKDPVKKADLEKAAQNGKDQLQKVAEIKKAAEQAYQKVAEGYGYVADKLNNPEQAFEDLGKAIGDGIATASNEEAAAKSSGDSSLSGTAARLGLGAVGAVGGYALGGVGGAAIGAAAGYAAGNALNSAAQNAGGYYNLAANMAGGAASMISAGASMMASYLPGALPQQNSVSNASVGQTVGFDSTPAVNAGGLVGGGMAAATGGSFAAGTAMASTPEPATIQLPSDLSPAGFAVSRDTGRAVSGNYGASSGSGSSSSSANTPTIEPMQTQAIIDTQVEQASEISPLQNLASNPTQSLGQSVTTNPEPKSADTKAADTLTNAANGKSAFNGPAMPALIAPAANAVPIAQAPVGAAKPASGAAPISSVARGATGSSATYRPDSVSVKDVRYGDLVKPVPASSSPAGSYKAPDDKTMLEESKPLSPVKSVSKVSSASYASFVLGPAKQMPAARGIASIEQPSSTTALKPLVTFKKETTTALKDALASGVAGLKTARQPVLSNAYAAGPELKKLQRGFNIDILTIARGLKKDDVRQALDAQPEKLVGKPVQPAKNTVGDKFFSQFFGKS